MVRLARGVRFEARVERLSLAIVAYRGWQERNQRTFQNKIRNEVAVLKEIESYLQTKIWRWSVCRSFTNWSICKSCGFMK